MLYGGPRGGERCGYDGTICGRIGDRVCIFCGVKRKATEGISVGYDSTVKGQLCV